MSIPIVYQRSSSLGQFKYCQMSWFIGYILGHTAPSNAKADLGSTVHAVFEILAIAKKYIQDNKVRKNGSFKIVQEPIGEITIKMSEFYTNDFIDSLIEKCLKFYIKHNPHNNFDYDKDYKFCKKGVYDTLSFNNGEFDPRYCNILQPEQGFDMPLEFDWAKYQYEEGGKIKEDYLRIKGTIDLTTIVDDKSIQIVDYKTGQRKDWSEDGNAKKEYPDLMKDIQLLLYNYAIYKLYPQYDNVFTTIFFCRDGGPYYLVFDEIDRAKFLDRLKNIHNEMQNSIPKPRSYSRGDFRCTKLCKYLKDEWKDSGMSMCHYIEKHLKEHGVEKTMKDCTKEGFNIAKYVDPGSVDR